MYIRNGININRNPGKFTGGYLSDVLSVISGSRAVRIPINDIEVVEQAGRVLHIITAYDDFTCFESIESIADMLEERGFYRAMKKVLINLEKVMEMTGREIIFMSGTSVVMGRNNFLGAKKAFKQYMMEYPQFTLWRSTSSLASELNKTERLFQNTEGKEEQDEAPKAILE